MHDAWTPGARPIALVLDGRPPARGRLAQMLTSAADLSIVECGTSREALEWLSAVGTGDVRGPSLMTVHMDLPDMSGLGFCRTVRDKPFRKRLRAVPAIAVSPVEDDDVLAAALDAGATDCVCEPLRPVEVVTRVRAALRAHLDGERDRLREKRLGRLAHELARRCETLQHMPGLDPTTCVPNWHYFEAAISTAWERARVDSRPLAVVLLEPRDREAPGPVAPEELRRVATALSGALQRPGDALCRCGDQFIALLPDTGASGAAVVAARMAGTLERLGVDGGWCTPCGGYAAAEPTPAHTPIDLVDHAREALAGARRDGPSALRGVNLAVPSARN